MKNLHTLGTPELIDLLSYMTIKLTSSLHQKNKDASQFEYDLSMIQGEINARQNAKQVIKLSQGMFR